MTSESAVGAHFDEETSIEALAYQYSQAEGSGREPTKKHWERAREEVARRLHLSSGSTEAHPKSASKPSAFDMRVEEAMHLDR